ncbi:MAG: hypothetical protein ACI9SC_002422, partial [Gammaproteobacteria bacterium]
PLLPNVARLRYDWHSSLANTMARIKAEAINKQQLSTLVCFFSFDSHDLHWPYFSS